MKNLPKKRNGSTKRFYSIALLQFVFCMQMFAKTNPSQNINEVYINLNINNKNFEYVFSKIEEKTTFRFTYVKSVIPAEKTITLRAENKSLKKVLNELGSKLNVKFIQNNTRILVKPNSFTSVKSATNQQTFEIKGIVKDNTGLALPGASIQVKGTSRGTVTDFDGNFTITVLENEVLVVNFLGYKSKEITINSSDFLTINLEEDTNALNEVVVTALNIERAEKIQSQGVHGVLPQAQNNIGPPR